MALTCEDAVSDPMVLSDLPKGVYANVVDVVGRFANDIIAERLQAIGFTPGQRLRVVAYAPWGKDPIMVEVGATRFALRASEASRVSVAVLGVSGLPDCSSRRSPRATSRIWLRIWSRFWSQL